MRAVHAPTLTALTRRWKAYLRTGGPASSAGQRCIGVRSDREFPAIIGRSARNGMRSPGSICSVGVGTSSGIVRQGSCAGYMFHICSYLSAVIRRLVSSVGSSRQDLDRTGAQPHCSSGRRRPDRFRPDQRRSWPVSAMLAPRLDLQAPGRVDQGVMGRSSRTPSMLTSIRSSKNATRPRTCAASCSGSS